MTDKNTRILITGATGFVGSNVVRQLVFSGYKEVYCLYRSTAKLSLIEDIAGEIKLIKGDLLDIHALDEILSQIDLVIHTAAMVSFRKTDGKSMMQTNIEGTANLVNLCLEHKIKRFIHVSSIAAFGRKENGKMMDETCEWESSKINSDYAISKYLSEMEVWRAFAEGLKGAIVNPSVIIGAGYWKTGTGEFFSRIYNGLLFYPVGTNGFVDVRDVAGMIIRLAESDITEQRFICNSENVRYKSLFDQMALQLNKKPPSIKLSKKLVGLLAFIIDFYNFLFGTKSNLSSQSLRNASFDSFYDNSKSVDLLKYKYIPVSKTIEDTCRVFKDSMKQNSDFGIFLSER
ncbi:MAG: SDR family NAD(P)-dependent oxidoreductase [Deltaproteobacteria bacterium]